MKLANLPVEIAYGEKEDFPIEAEFLSAEDEDNDTEDGDDDDRAHFESLMGFKISDIE